MTDQDTPDTPDTPQPPPVPQETPWTPTFEDLADWAKILCNDAYSLRARRQCSFSDYAEGFVGALVALRWRPAFAQILDNRPFPSRAMALPGLVEAFVVAGPTTIPKLPEALVGALEASEAARIGAPRGAGVAVPACGRALVGGRCLAPSGHGGDHVPPPYTRDLTAGEIARRERAQRRVEAGGGEVSLVPVVLTLAPDSLTADPDDQVDPAHRASGEPESTE